MGNETVRVESLKEKALKEVDEITDLLIKVSGEIHDNPELSYKEYGASNLLTDILEDYGFEVDRPAASLETGFIATKSGTPRKPRVAFLAEYDALPGVGHGCGHNLIGSAALGAGIALGRLLDEVGGAVSVFGTPAEEKGSGKIAFCDAGLFDDVDVGMICHAHAHPKKGWISGYTLLAVNSLTFEFHGEPAHAASDPYNGVNALDALVQTYNSVSTLRQQLKEDIRIHGVIEEGGLIPNIIPDYTRGVFWVRAPNTRELDEATDKVINCAKGAALATGTKLDVQRVSLEKDFLVNKPLLLLFEKNCHLLDLDFLIKSELIRGSSDVGNVSYICPTLSFEFPLSDKPEGIKVHSQEFAEAAVGETAHKNMILSAKLMALIAVDVLTDLDIAKAARRELDEKQRIRETRDK